MKTNLLSFKKLAFTIVLVVASTLLSLAIEVSKTLSKNAVVPEGTKIVMQNKSGDLDITTSTENVVKITTNIRVVGNNQDDIDKLMKGIEEFKFEQLGDEFEIDTRFWENINSINGRKTIKLLNGEKIKISKFEISQTLVIPVSSELELANKYSDVNLADISQKVLLSVYDGNLTAGNFTVPSEIKMKYAKGNIGSCSGLKLNLYDSDLILEEADDVKLNSKYSSLVTRKINNLKGSIYDDRLKIEELANGEISSKYSDFKFGNVSGDLKLDIYDDKFEVGNVNAVTYKSKYSELDFAKVGTITSSYSYDDIVNVLELGSLTIEESKYTDYKIGTLSSSLLVIGYDDTISMENVDSGFEKIYVKGKYTSVKMDIQSPANYGVEMDIKYPKVVLPDNLKIVQKIKEKEQLHLRASVGTGGGNIKVDGYDMSIRIR